MASELVEKVARALCKESGDDPDMVFTDQNSPEWNEWKPQARAAIKAVAEYLEAREGVPRKNKFGFAIVELLAQLEDKTP
jgi:hypothetical protein